MQYLILAVALLSGLLLAARWYATADPKAIRKALGTLLVAAAILLFLFLLVTGRIFWMLMALPALIPLYFKYRGMLTAAKNFSRMAQGFAGGGGATGQASEVSTRFLRMTLDHDTGAVTGEVLEGEHQGRSLESLSTEELVRLLRAYWTEDADSCRVLESYLDRTREGWRDMAEEEAERAHAESKGEAFAEGPMTKEEAYRILGLQPGASPDEIKQAYHRLMAALHPDHGGSDYLAAKINQAKAMLLDD